MYKDYNEDELHDWQDYAMDFIRNQTWIYQNTLTELCSQRYYDFSLRKGRKYFQEKYGK